MQIEFQDSQPSPVRKAVTTGVGARSRAYAAAARCGSARQRTAAIMVAVALLLSACGGHGSITAYGYHIEVEGAQRLEFADGVATAKTSNHDLRVAEGRLWVDGVDLGAVVEGDKIRMSSDGKAWVNGEERKSTD